jgi:hypothetical protein
LVDLLSVRDSMFCEAVDEMFMADGVKVVRLPAADGHTLTVGATTPSSQAT